MKALVKRWAFGEGTAEHRVRTGPLRGSKLLLDPSSDGQRILGLAERELVPHLARHLPDAASFVDVGAGSGWYTLMAARHPARPRVLAIEPDEGARRTWAENLRLNGLDRNPRISLVPEAIGATGSSLDELTAHLPGPLLVKMDIEGAERDVLARAPRTVARDDVTWIVETHDLAIEHGCIAILEASGHRVHVIDPAFWRRWLPENRPAAHNRWFVARKRQ